MNGIALHRFILEIFWIVSDEVVGLFELLLVSLRKGASYPLKLGPRPDRLEVQSLEADSQAGAAELEKRRDVEEVGCVDHMHQLWVREFIYELPIEVFHVLALGEIARGQWHRKVFLFVVLIVLAIILYLSNPPTL